MKSYKLFTEGLTSAEIKRMAADSENLAKTPDKRVVNKPQDPVKVVNKLSDEQIANMRASSENLAKTPDKRVVNKPQDTNRAVNADVPKKATIPTRDEFFNAINVGSPDRSWSDDDIAKMRADGVEKTAAEITKRSDDDAAERAAKRKEFNQKAGKMAWKAAKGLGKGAWWAAKNVAWPLTKGAVNLAIDGMVAYSDHIDSQDSPSVSNSSSSRQSSNNYTTSNNNATIHNRGGETIGNIDDRGIHGRNGPLNRDRHGAPSHRYDNGEVRRNAGGRVGRIDDWGRINAGKNVGSIDNDGNIRRNGSTIGKINGYDKNNSDHKMMAVRMVGESLKMKTYKQFVNQL